MNEQWTIERLRNERPQIKVVEVGTERIVNATPVDMNDNACTLVISGTAGISNLVGVGLQDIVNALNKGEPLDLALHQSYLRTLRGKP